MYTDRKKPEIITSIYLEKRVSNKEGKHPVKLRLTYQRKRKYYALKLEHYSVNDFEAIYSKNARGEIKLKRKKFESIENTAIDIIDNQLDSFSFDAFEREYLKRKDINETIQSYFEIKVNELKSNDKYQSASLYVSTLSSLELYDANLSFEKITPTFLNKYEKWMLENEKSYTTIGIYSRHLRHIINRAVKNKLIHEYPFGKENDKYSIPYSKNFKKALSINEVECLFKYTPKNDYEKRALSYWLFSYLCNGMNMKDILNLKFKNINGNSLTFIRSKTKDTAKNKTEILVHLLPFALDIIKEIGNKKKDPETYVFPVFKVGLSEIEKHKKIKQHIKNTNKFVKRIAKNIGLDENITTYWARHSYSTILKRSGAPIEFISEQLGHQNTIVTKNYLDTFEQEQRAKFSESLIDFEKKE